MTVLAVRRPRPSGVLVWLHVFRSWLPQGNLLRPTTWAVRHRLITRFALLQALCLAGYALLAGRGPFDALLSALIVAAPAIPGLFSSLSRRLRMLSVVISLMSASAVLVDLSNGLIEAHFHYFVMIGVVSLYQDWAAFGMCVLATVLHHAVMGIASPDSVFIGEIERAHPIRFAVIHGAFVLAASVTHIIAWKLNELQALRDTLTRLPNRRSFLDRLKRELSVSDEPISVLYVDIDNFKTINDSGGHHVGDMALAHAADVMARTMRADDFIARIGGDEFAAIVPGVAEDALAAAERILTALRSPLVAGRREVTVTASIGVADTLLAESRDSEDLLRDADLAMYAAKSAGKNRASSYRSGMDNAVVQQAELAQDLQVALGQGQLEIHYQPVFLPREQRMCGVEALLRWRHPERGMVPPSEFVPLAEKSGEIRAIGAWVLRTAARQVAEWQRTLPGCEQLELAVNLSPDQLRDPELLDTVASALDSSGLAPGCLILEVTETMLLSDLDLARQQLDAARTMGALVAIDDFGTGYSSLSYLAKLPADQVKIDRSFVQELVPGSTAVALVRTIIELATALSLDIQAEGVEEPEQQLILDQLGCPRSQGYLYSRPLSVPDFAGFVTLTRAADPDPVIADAEPPVPAQASASVGAPVGASAGARIAS